MDVRINCIVLRLVRKLGDDVNDLGRIVLREEQAEIRKVVIGLVGLALLVATGRKPQIGESKLCAWQTSLYCHYGPPLVSRIRHLLVVSSCHRNANSSGPSRRFAPVGEIILFSAALDAL